LVISDPGFQSTNNEKKIMVKLFKTKRQYMSNARKLSMYDDVFRHSVDFRF